MRILFYNIVCLFILILSTNVHAWTPNEADKDIIIATVNGEPVTLFDVKAETEKEEEFLRNNNKGEELQKKIDFIRRRAADDIILRILVSKKFDDSGYKVPAQLIEKMMDRIAADLAGGDRKLLETKARRAGVTIRELKEQARKRAATMMLINARCYQFVYATPKEVYEYYQNHKDKFTEERRIDLQALYLKSVGDDDDNIIQFAIKLKGIIQNADEDKFKEFVKKYSMGPNKDKGGELGWISISELRPEFFNAVKDLKEGEIAGPVKTPEGYYFLRVKEINHPNEKSFEKVKSKIKTELENAQKKKNYLEYTKKIRKNAIIKYFSDSATGNQRQIKELSEEKEIE